MARIGKGRKGRPPPLFKPPFLRFIWNGFSSNRKRGKTYGNVLVGNDCDAECCGVFFPEKGLKMNGFFGRP